MCYKGIMMSRLNPPEGLNLYGGGFFKLRYTSKYQLGLYAFVEDPLFNIITFYTSANLIITQDVNNLIKSDKVYYACITDYCEIHIVGLHIYKNLFHDGPFVIS